MQTAKVTTSAVNQAVAGTQGVTTNAEPLKMCKRIGSTVYEVRVYFNQDAKETMDSKILRLIKNDVHCGKVAV